MWPIGAAKAFHADLNSLRDAVAARALVLLVALGNSRTGLGQRLGLGPGLP